MPGAIEELKATWDEAIDAFLDGGPAYTDELRSWFDSYRGRGLGSVYDDALPEPYFGRLDGPRVVFLALNPGQPFLGTRTWSRGTPMPDLQSRSGVFSEEIRAAGSYSAWARHFPDWTRWAPSPNTFFTSRLRFARDWTDSPSLEMDDLLNLEVYPWHSVKFTALPRLDPTVIALMRRYLLDPLAATGAKWAFAFGKAWFTVLDALGLESMLRLSTREGDTWDHAPKDRIIQVYRVGNVTIVAEMHSGGAGPPKSIEVPVLRSLIEPKIT